MAPQAPQRSARPGEAGARLDNLAPQVEEMAAAIIAMLRAGPVFFMDLVRAHREAPYRTLLLAWGDVREAHRLSRDDEGRYFLAAAEQAR